MKIIAPTSDGIVTIGSARRNTKATLVGERLESNMLFYYSI